MIDFLKWVITRHILPYGLISAGTRSELESNFLTMDRIRWSKCKVCGDDLVGWRRLKLCRKFACYKEAAHA